MNQRILSRRAMLRNSALAGIGVWLSADGLSTHAASPNEKLQVACIGIGGRGRANVDGLRGQNLVALCDVDDKRAGDAYEKYSRAEKFRDYRRMFDRLEKQIDAVVVSTPDHTHFHPSIAAMVRGKHLYCEKPMAHSLWEVRTMTDLAREKKIATQLGVQRHTHGNVHRVVEMIQAGAIGEVTECYAWVGGDRGMTKIPTDTPPVPETLDWDLWLGPAAERPYSPEFAPYGWRFWWDFGTGETGNWGCHVLDIPFWALELDFPTRVEASGPPVDPQRTPKAMDSTLVFPEKTLSSGRRRSAVKLHWMHSTTGPAILEELGMPKGGTKVLFIGKKGQLLCDFSHRKLYPEADFADYQEPEKTIPDSPGFHQEWVLACKGGERATCHFDYSGPMAETVLLANLAYRSGAAFEWDAKSLKASDPRAASGVRTPFRKGWEVEL